jgi:NAD dependent epimerase/dehydratase family
MKILILGATGAAGSSLFELALASPRVTEVRTISRRAIASGHAKHTGFQHGHLTDYAAVSDAFAGLDACFYCIGRATTLVAEQEYRLLALDAPQAAAKELHTRSPEAVFHYLSGLGASLASDRMWARIKAEAECALIDQYRAVCWRPGAIDSRNTAGWPAFYRLLIPLIRILAPSRRFYVKGDDLARAMLQLASTADRSRILENLEIRRLADEFRAHEPPAG